MLGPSQGLKGPQHMPGQSPIQRSTWAIWGQPLNLRVTLQVHLQQGHKRCEERSGGRWVLACHGVGSTFWLTEHLAAGLPSTKPTFNPTKLWQGLMSTRTRTCTRRRWLFVPQGWLSDAEIKHLPALIGRG